MVYAASLLLLLCGDIIILDIIGAQYDDCRNGMIHWKQDGYCDTENNDESCGYDGGDCCECTCINRLDHDCGENGFFCRDPNSDCVDPRIERYPNCTDGHINYIQDGWCDDDNNNETCGYDGGDCCECTCINGLDYYCGETDFFCQDPNSDCIDPLIEMYSNCTNGTIEPYICTQMPPTYASCPAAPQHEWVVGNTTQARALSDAVRCPGGSFHVTWIGKVILNETIYVTDGTVLNVTNGDANSSIIGEGKTRLFTVVNASLSLVTVMPFMAGQSLLHVQPLPSRR